MPRPLVLLCLATLAQAPVAELHASPRPLAKIRATRRAPDRSMGLVQITGKRQRVGQTKYRLRSPADPFVDDAPNGVVRVLGTTPYGQAHYYIEFKSLDDLLRGGRYVTRKLALEPRLTGKENAWDWNVHRFPDGTEVMYAGVMTPTVRRKIAAWPDDNWTRRIYGFAKDKLGRWAMGKKPLFGAVGPTTRATMIGHAYGHHFRTLRRGGKDEVWVFHEEISGEIDTPQGKKLKTEIFARRMLDPFTASEERVKILGVGDPPILGRRQSGDYLIEGPRPFSVEIDGEEVHLVTFSGADYAGDGYDIHFAWRKGDAIGEYQPITREGRLVGFAEKLKQKYALSWVGRADMVKDRTGKWWAVFHAVNKEILPDRDYSGNGKVDVSQFQRNLYAIPVEFRRGADGAPEIEFVDGPGPKEHTP
jgi:hypothetical protein